MLSWRAVQRPEARHRLRNLLFALANAVATFTEIALCVIVLIAIVSILGFVLVNLVRLAEERVRRWGMEIEV